MVPSKFIIEGLDRLGKSTLISNLRHRLGYFEVIHYSKPVRLACYQDNVEGSPSAAQRYQTAGFNTMFSIIVDAQRANIILDRAHLGEAVNAPLYRGYSGDYVFKLEAEYGVERLTDTRLVLLTEDFNAAQHFVDDGESLGSADKRRDEQKMFLAAFERSLFPDKRIVCVTDSSTGAFKSPQSILEEVLQ